MKKENNGLPKSRTAPALPRMSDIKIKQLDSTSPDLKVRKPKRQTDAFQGLLKGESVISNTERSQESIKDIKSGSSNLINIIGDSKPKNPGGLKKLGSV